MVVDLDELFKSDFYDFFCKTSGFRDFGVLRFSPPRPSREGANLWLRGPGFNSRGGRRAKIALGVGIFFSFVYLRWGRRYESFLYENRRKNSGF